MPLTKISTDGVKDDAIDASKLPANSVGASELADNAVDTNAIADQAVALSKLPHGDGSSNGKFLRANNGADPTFESIPAGVGGSTGVDFNDNVKARFGTGNDLQIYHDGTDTFMLNTTGVFRISDDSEIRLGKASIERPYVKCIGDAQVELYYDNNKSLETTADGGVKAQGNYIVGTSGRGIQFNASDSGSSELLDDYEEGTFTPTLNRAGSNPSSAGFYSQHARYTKIGNLVHVQIIVDAHSVSGGSGHWYVGNFPFATENADTGWSNTWVAARMYFDGDYAMGVDGMTLRANYNKTDWYLYNQDDDTAVTSNGTRIIFQGHVTYRTNS